jgi:hypothetical protein
MRRQHPALRDGSRRRASTALITAVGCRDRLVVIVVVVVVVTRRAGSAAASWRADRRRRGRA